MAVSTAEAAIVLVSNTNDSGAGSLRAAIASASSGDTIKFLFTGTITLTSDELSIDKNLTIEGPGDPALLTVQRSFAAGTPAFSIIRIGYPGGNRTVSLSNLTIRNGKDGGAGITSGSHNDVTLTNCIFRDNVSPDRCGGAILNFASKLTVVGCVFTQNSAFESPFSNPTPDGGGAICNESADTAAILIVQNSVFENNYAETGGGAIASYGKFQDSGTAPPSVTVDNCTFTDNTSDRTGGAIQAVRGSLAVAGSLFRGNDAEGSGGGIYSFATVTVETSTFSENTSEGAGGGLYNGTVTSVVRSLFKDNVASEGGGIWTQGETSLTNSTFSRNRAIQGGAIYNTGGVTVTSCTLSENSGGLSGAIFQHFPSGAPNTELGNTLLKGNGIQVSSGTVISNGYNLSSDNGGGFLVGPGDRISTDPKLDPLGLQDNGGPTQTIALIAGSPAIDQGNSFGLATDQRGFQRTIENLSVPNATDGTDIGAFEAPIDPQQSGEPSFVVTNIDDHNDGVCGGADCTLREAILRANAIPEANTITFAPSVIGVMNLQGAAGGQLNITGPTTIIGPGARALTVSGFGIHRVFSVSGNGSSSISGLTIFGGKVSGGLGATNDGGGVHNATVLSLTDCTLQANGASGSSGGGGAATRNGGAGRGGAIFNAGVLTLTRCTLRDNVATGGFGADNPPPDDFVLTTGGNGGSALGGAVFNDTSGLLAISNCTFVANNAGAASGGSGHNGGNGGSGLGGGVYSLGLLNVYGSTFSGNTGFGAAGGGSRPGGTSGSPGVGAGGLARAGGTSTLGNTISAGNSASGTFRYDIFGAFTSAGYNLIGRIEGGSGFTATGDQTGSNATPLNARLAALANNGGHTDTLRLLANSPATDRGNGFALTTDQRGSDRPSDNPAIANASGGDGSDIGAYEVGGLLVVTTLDDHSDGTCNASDCTLREAILAADDQSLEENIIAFATGLTGAIQLVSSLPQLATNTRIVGPGAGLLTVRRNNNFDFRIFLIGNNTSSGPTVSISGLTITNGRASSDSGGGILNSYSTLTISDCVITGNSAGGFGGRGGGIANNHGTLFINNTTVSGNSAFYGGGIANFRDNPGVAGVSVTNSTVSGNTAAGDGAALYNSATNSGSSAQLILSNCTLSGNAASGAFGGSGGALSNIGSNSASVTAVLTGCTLSGNTASNIGGGIHNVNSGGGAFVIMGGTILETGSSGANLANSAGSISSQGYNLSDDNGSGFLTATGDQSNTDPLLGGLTHNGGATQTHALLRNSPAIDRGQSFGFATDQRGLARIANAAHLPDAAGGDGADIGAVETHPFGGSLADADADGMADEWEIFYGVDDPNGDGDGDGDSNLKEYLHGTNPRNSASLRLRVIAIARTGNNITLTFNGVANRTFQLERKAALTESSWTVLDGVTITPTITGNAQLTHLGGATPAPGFYRVRLLP